ncbi:MAG: hypothetical protein R2828_21365 [Saprospiraceae bacterium]
MTKQLGLSASGASGQSKYECRVRYLPIFRLIEAESLSRTLVRIPAPSLANQGVLERRAGEKDALSDLIIYT